MIEGFSILAVAGICLGVFLASLVDAIGGGGGLISLPTYMLAGLPMHYALGTNKLSACIGTTASTARFVAKGFVDWGLAVPSILLALVGSHLGTRLQLIVDADILRYVLIVVLIVVAVVMLKKRELPETAGEIDVRLRRLIVWGAAFVIGMYDGFYGPGTGTFLLLIFCRLAKMDLNTASGNMKIINFSSNIGACLTSLAAGKAYITIGLISSVFSILGHYIGAGLMIRNGSKIVTPIIFTVLTLLLLRVVLELCGVTLG